MPDDTSKVCQGATSEPVRRRRRTTAELPFRRAALRIDLAVEVDFESDHNFYTGISRNIATGGVFVRTAAVLPIGSRLRVRLKLPTLAEPVELDAIVRWVREVGDVEQHGMGLELLEPSPELSAAIAAFVARRESLYHEPV